MCMCDHLPCGHSSCREHTDPSKGLSFENVLYIWTARASSMVMWSHTCSWPEKDRATGEQAQPWSSSTEWGRECFQTCNCRQLHLLPQRRFKVPWHLRRTVMTGGFIRPLCFYREEKHKMMRQARDTRLRSKTVEGWTLVASHYFWNPEEKKKDKNLKAGRKVG